MHFLTFLVTVVELSNYQLFQFCKLDKILRNFPSLQNFVFVAVYEMAFEFCHFMLCGCDILELYSKSHRVSISMKLLENHIALLFQRSYSKITSRCYFTEVTRKSHRVAISSKYSKSHRVAICNQSGHLLLVLNFD